MIRAMSTLAVATALAAGLSGCSEEPTASAQTPAVAASPDQVVAEIGGKPITLKDVDAKWEALDAAEHSRIVQALYQNRRNMLDQIIGDRLIEDAAKAAGQPVDKFLEADAVKRLKPISEEDVAQFYEQNKDRAEGRTLDQLRAEIKPYLEQRRVLQARAMLVDELRGKNKSVKVLLDPPRYHVPVAAGDPVRGGANATVTIVEFSDFQCPFCQRVNPTLAKLRETYGDRIKLVFKDYPLPNHPQAPKAAEAARCAAEQNKFWEMHDAMFANQRALEVPALKQTARTLGINGAAFDACLDTGKHADTVAKNAALGEQMGVNSTPTLYINGRQVLGAMPFEVFKQVIDEELARK